MEEDKYDEPYYTKEEKKAIDKKALMFIQFRKRWKKEIITLNYA